MKRRSLTLAVALAVLLAGCAGDDDDKRVDASKPKRSTTTTTTDMSATSLDNTTTTAVGATTTTRKGGATATTGSGPSATNAPGSVDRVVLQKIATLQQPIAFAVRPGETDAVFIAQKGGRVKRLRLTSAGATVDPVEVMNLNSQITKGNEQGLLGLAFSADGATLYASFTNSDGDTRVVAYPYAAGQAAVGSGKVIIGVDQPDANHNGGQITFGPDGHLYLALGDGGGAGDPLRAGQDLRTLLGKMLRISPKPSGGYTVPADNPFVGRSDARPEIWHYGLRNPWRSSFDRTTGEQWIADVGQGDYEEVNHVAAGAKGLNFGWNLREGKHAYNGGAKPDGAVDPEYELNHSDGNCSITGGYVYRGSRIRGFAGTYVFGDYCRGRLLGASGGTVRDLGPKLAAISSFGEDAAGELWVLSLDGDVYRLIPG